MTSKMALRQLEFRLKVSKAGGSAYIKEEHDAGKTVIMVGDGINDTPAMMKKVLSGPSLHGHGKYPYRQTRRIG